MTSAGGPPDAATEPPDTATVPESAPPEPQPREAAPAYAEPVEAFAAGAPEPEVVAAVDVAPAAVELERPAASDPAPAAPAVIEVPPEPTFDAPSERGISRRRFVVTAPAITLTALVSGVVLMFLLIEPSPRWIVLFGTAVSTFALDGVLRASRREAFVEGGLDTTPQLLVPALYVLTMPVFIEHNSLGYWSTFGGLAAGAGYGALVIGALSSVREHDAGRVPGRFIVTAATYVVAFSMFSLVFLFGVGQTAATVAVGLAATLLAAEILREGEIDPGETLLYSLVTGIVIAEVRWLVHYLPVQGYAAALALLLAFYLVTGLLHSHVVRQLTSRVAAEYASVGALGAAFIAGLRLAGLA